MRKYKSVILTSMMAMCVMAPKMNIYASEEDIHLPKISTPNNGEYVEVPNDDVYLPKVDIEIPEVDVNLPKADIDISGPKVDIDVPDVNIDEFEGPDVPLEGPKIKMPEEEDILPKIEEEVPIVDESDQTKDMDVKVSEIKEETKKESIQNNMVFVQTGYDSSLNLYSITAVLAATIAILALLKTKAMR